MSTINLRLPVPASHSAAETTDIDRIERADRNRWTQHLAQIAAFYPLARPRILRPDSTVLRANPSAP